MSPLDDLKRIQADRPSRGGTRTSSNPQGLCYYCLGDGHGAPHEPDCPMLDALPQIVRVLEAAERVAALDLAVSVDDGDSGCGEYGCCGALDYRGHESDCPQQALVSALKAT